MDEGDIRSLTENTFESYRDLIYRTYFAGARSYAAIDGAMPVVTPEARALFEQIPDYEQMAENNFDDLTFKKGVVIRLAKIKNDVAALNTSIPDEESQAYTDALKPIIAEFSRLTRDMVTGEEVADADNGLKNLKDQNEYVHDDLLTGPGGCETQLAQLYSNNQAVYKKYVRRQPYPIKIDHFYGTVAQGPTQIPWNANLIDSWDPNEGFMYGSVYWNFWARPYDGGSPYTPDNKSHNPPNLAAIKAGTCPEFIGIVEFSLPDTADIGGLDPVGSQSNSIIKYGDNKCGVITRKFEKMFGIY